MPTEILLAPVGTGKTERGLERLLRVIEDRARPFARAWVLLPTLRQQDALRARLVERGQAQTGGQRVFFNVELFGFYDLYRRLLDIAGAPARELDESARLTLLRRILTERRDQLRVFGGIATTPGFVQVVADFIYELKQGLIRPEEFRQKAQSEKDHDLALIYEAYQTSLQNYDLVDREGEGWLALAKLRDLDKPIQLGGLSMLLVDGFDQFNPLQARIISWLGFRSEEAMITLTTVPGRERSIGRRFQGALEELQRAHTQENLPEPITTIIPLQADDRHADLQHLLANIAFTPKPVSTRGGLSLIEAADPAREVGAVLRQVKRLLLDGGAQPDDILIALRDWERYRPYFSAIGKAYGLPLTLHYTDPLRENPAMIALVNLLELPANDFPTNDLLDVLRSPYLSVPDLDAQAVELLERISREVIVTGGRAAWLEALEALAQPPDDLLRGDDDEPADRPVTTEQAVALRDALSAFFTGITPPSTATTREYVEWLEQRIGPDPEKLREDEDESTGTARYRLALLVNVRARNAGSEIRARDMRALHQLKRILRALLAAEELLRALTRGQAASLTWGEFWRDLLGPIEAEHMEANPPRSGRVLVTSANNARGLPHQHVFILGLSEGMFPQRISEDPLYLDSERIAHRERGIPLLTRAERAADDGVFYELIGLPRASLTLSRPYLDGGKPWIESHLWRQAARLFRDVPLERVRPGEVVDAESVASPEEAALAAASLLNLPNGNSAAGLIAWLEGAQGAYWDRVVRGRAIDARRMSRAAPHDAFSGRLRDARLVAAAREQFGRTRIWSASQLGEFGQCAFRYFTKRLLKLEALEQPEEGLNAQMLGTIYHAILEHTYARVGELGLTISAENRETALAILDQVAAQVLAEAPRKLGFRADSVWREEQSLLLRRLVTLIEMDFSSESLLNHFSNAPRAPYMQEAPFGIDSPLELPLPNGETIRVRGFIDRIDVQGDAVIVADYKSGATKIPTDEIMRGRNFQMMLYLLAARHILDMRGDTHQVAGGLFWHLSSREASGQLTPDDEAMGEGQKHLARYLAQARTGDFSARVTKMEDGKCARYCEFAKMCRVAIAARKRPLKDA